MSRISFHMALSSASLARISNQISGEVKSPCACFELGLLCHHRTVKLCGANNSCSNAISNRLSCADDMTISNCHISDLQAEFGDRTEAQSRLPSAATRRRGIRRARSSRTFWSLRCRSFEIRAPTRHAISPSLELASDASSPLKAVRMSLTSALFFTNRR